MTTRKFTLKESISQRLVGCVASALVLMLLGVGCTKEVTPNGELDLSKRTEVTLKSVAVASGGSAASVGAATSSSRAVGDTPMPVGSQFRLYVMANGSEQILETRTYTITTQAGTPEIDADQDPLMLPFGELDVYLVGPLSYTAPAYSYDDGTGATVDVPEQIVPIALEDGVEPQLGIDLISSLTTIKVLETKDNTFAANPLQHKMSQLDIVIERYKSESGVAVYENMDMEYISIDNVALSGDFVFDANGGTITTSSSSTLLFSGDQIEVTLDGAQKDKFRVTEYVMPRPKKKSKIEIEFSYNLVGESSGTAKKKRVFSGITSDSPFVSGTRMQFTSMPVMGIDLIFRDNLLPWDDGGSVGIDPPTNLELAVWYSGEDAPEAIYGDGKMYWRDRSGNGNHALIDKGLYDAAGKFYYPSPGGSPSFVVPPLWNDKNTDYTVELAAQTISATTLTVPSQHNGMNALYFSSTDHTNVWGTANTIKVELPSSTIQFYSGGFDPQTVHFAGGTANNPADKTLHEQFHTFAFARTAGNGYTFVNGKLHQAHTMASDWLAFNGPNNYLWQPVAVVAPHNKKMRLYGVKIYRSCKKTDTGLEVFGTANAELTANYTTYLSRLAKSNIADNDYVKDGLILDLRGADVTADGATWSDRSGYGNHFKKLGTLVSIAGESYKFAHNDKSSYLKSAKSMGPQKEITIEIVITPNCADFSNLCVFQANDIDKQEGYGCTTFYYPGNNATYVDAPDRLTIPMGKYPNGAITTTSQVCVQRRGNEVLFWQNGALPDVAPKITSAPLKDWNYVTIGANLAGTNASNGWIYAVRIYNRPLTEIERQHNYLLDKKTYNLLFNNP